MIDEILAGIFGEAVFGRIGHSRRAELVARLFFGVLGAGLGLVGAVHVAQRIDTPNRVMSASMVAAFLFLSCFSLFNVALARAWRWPGTLFLVSLAAVIVSRLALGA
jgi:uncharacterized membrane protein